MAEKKVILRMFHTPFKCDFFLVPCRVPVSVPPGHSAQLCPGREVRDDGDSAILHEALRVPGHVQLLEQKDALLQEPVHHNRHLPDAALFVRRRQTVHGRA